MRLPLLLVAALAMAACAPGTATGPTRASGEQCVALYRQYDILEQLYPNNRRRDQNRSANPLVEAQGQRVRNAGCITLTRDLVGMEAITGPAVTNSGPPIAPISVHAGVVTNMEDDARSRAFFSSQGVSARSIGSAPLGRRVYLGPFATQGALDQARDLALRAGFIAPYPARF